MTGVVARAGTSRLRVSSAPCSFGVDEVVKDDAWMPGPDQMLDWMAAIGYEGTEMGPPGFLGVGQEVRGRLDARALQLVGAFLPQHLSRADRAQEDRAWLRSQLRSMREATPQGSQPLAVLCEAIDEADRMTWSGAIADHPEAVLPPDRFATLVDALHRAGELCAEEGFGAVIHPHAGTYLETADEIERLMERLDGSLVGLCLDTGHFRYGGTDPAQAVRDYAGLLRHVHLKDCRAAVVERVRREGGGFAGAVAHGVFAALGEGDSGIPEVLRALDDVGYSGWLVVEQDQALTSADSPESLVAGQRYNLEYLHARGV
jgi:inosose dehydratase